MEKDLNVGIIGAGNIARKMAKTIKRLKGFHNYAIASRSLEKAEKFKKAYKFDVAYDSYEKLCMDEKVDLVYIATPHSCHYEQMQLCLKYKKPVLCEKSFTPSLKETTDIIAKFEKENVFLCEALWTSFMPSRTIIENIIDEGKIGKVVSMDATFKVPLTNKERVIKRELGGGVLMDIGIYPVTFVWRTLGFNYENYTVDEIKMFGDVDIKETITFNYSNGVKGVCHVDGSSTISLVVSIVGDNGSIWIDMVNCPNVIIVKSKKGLIKKIYLTKPKYGGFEYELIACKNAIQLGKKETEEWNHQNIISFAKIIEEILNKR